MKKKNSLSLVMSILLYLSIFLAQFRVFGITITFFEDNYISVVEKILILLLITITIVKILTSKTNAKEICIIGILILFSILSYLKTNSLTLSYLLLLPVASKNANFTNILRVDLISKIIVLLIVYACYKNGLAITEVVTRKGMLRESLGLAHPNNLGYLSLTCYIDASLLLLKSKKAKIIPLAIASMLPIYLCVISDSRTALYAIVFTFLSVITIPKINHHTSSSKSKKIIIFLIPLLLIFTSFYITREYNQGNEFSKKINIALSQRIKLQNHYDNNYKINILGNKIEETTFRKYPLDNGYYRILYSNGIIGLLCLLIIIEIALYKNIDSTIILSILILLLLYGLSEWVVFRLLITPFWTVAFTKKEENFLNETLHKEHK